MTWLAKPGLRCGLLSSAVIVPSLLLLSGCASSAQLPAQHAAANFQAAVHNHDTEAACNLLSQESRSALEQTSTQPCAVALKALDLTTGAPRTVEVWGDNAQARLPDGVLFLAKFPAGWKITGAECEAEPEDRYSCAVRS
ncbi:hypothetical protein [Microlunatus soli]|uniref:Lipoprotein n=1 Tax=Microlunatus soli TaxID=630515 RepID=A0A1H1NAQ1_9ACTN|nr:hypothetical protein [Microlunatus soli]SDR95409.1 hypothetical protein SAMN04489812_0427 [Microlunatus soli]